MTLISGSTNQPSESAAFAAPSDESAFFATDASVAGLTGTMKYKDVLSKPGDDNSPASTSQILIDLTGNQFTRQQAMYLFKLLFLVDTVPMND